MRLAWYAGVSTALAAGVVVSAFHQRANFYSAMVHLFQSNLSLMVLVNLTILVYSSFVYGLQRLCYGQLRAIEVEQLYDKAWFAVTETCLAMTIFRDEIGGSFIVMFVALLTGKVWGWIGEGRVEALEQQPPANPRLFHARLSVSLLLSLAYDSLMLNYTVQTVIEAARADMMVMFLFEFAVLTVASCHTAMRYGIVLIDSCIIRNQTQERLVARRGQVREERNAILQRRAAGEPDDGQPLPDEEDIDEMDIEVPGWEAKGQYVLVLDLWTDFVKLCLYAAFFFVLLSFYGLPLHIIRDLFMTVRSFIKRLGALMKYRQAMREMNRHPDATAEELARENTCIICREDMRVWDANDPTTVERSRPKKLPCGHILHLGCLKSWMERQQVCPTCRRPVVVNQEPQNRNGDAVLFRLGLNLRGDANGNAGENGNVGGPNGGAAAPHAGNNNARGGGAPANGQQPAANGGQPGGGGAVRMFNFGPLRLGFAQGGIQDIQQMAQRLGIPAGVAVGGAGAGAAPEAVPAGAPAALGAAAGAGFPPPFPAPPIPTGGGFLNHHRHTVPGGRFHFNHAPPAGHNGGPADTILEELNGIEQHINSIMQALSHVAHEAQLLREMTQNLDDGRANRIAGAHVAPMNPVGGAANVAAEVAASVATNVATDVATDVAADVAADVVAGAVPTAAPNVAEEAMNVTTFTRAAPLQAGHPDLPEGLQIPPGWTLVPLERFDVEDTVEEPSNAEPVAGPSSSDGQIAATTGTAPEATTNPPSWGGQAQMFNGSAATGEPAAEN